MRLGPAVLAATFAALLAGGAAVAHPSATPVLKGSVGPGFTISLTRNGAKVKTLKAGSYRFLISDKSTIHNFTLEREKGGAFETEITTAGFTGTRSRTLRLGPGEWKYYCRPHESIMFGYFTVK